MKKLDAALLLKTALSPTTNENAVRLLDTNMLLLPTIHLIAAVTKHGKTNMAANLVCSTLHNMQNKRVFVALNEETPSDFLIRCSCIMSGLSFAMWKGGRCAPQQKAQIAETAAKIVKRLDFPDEESINLGCLEDAEESVKTASLDPQISLVIFDYLQNVYLSKVYQAKNQYELSKLFGTKLKDIGKHTNCPVVVFGQLKDDKDAGFKSRIEGDSWFVNNVATGIELSADKLSKQSKLTVHIDRFQGRTHDEFFFNHQASGRLVSIASPGEQQ